MDAFAALQPVSEDYASLPVAEAFDWRDVGGQLGTGEWYLVAFRSIRRVEADEARLAEFDDRAHGEAQSSPGFVHYFKGPAAADRSCLSFCLWTSRSEARAAAGRPAHAAALTVIREMYERYTLEFLRVTGQAGAPLRFEPYDAQPATHPAGATAQATGLPATQPAGASLPPSGLPLPGAAPAS